MTSDDFARLLSEFTHSAESGDGVRRYELVVLGKTGNPGWMVPSARTTVSVLLTGATTMYFKANSTFTITNLTLLGTTGKPVQLRSTANGSSWYLNNVSTNNVSVVDVRDSDAIAV